MNGFRIVSCISVYVIYINIICLPVLVRPRNVDELGTCTHDLVYSHVILSIRQHGRYTVCYLAHILQAYTLLSIYPCRPQHCRRMCGSQITKHWWVSNVVVIALFDIIMYSTFTRPGRAKFENGTRARRVCQHTT